MMMQQNAMMVFDMEEACAEAVLTHFAEGREKALCLNSDLDRTYVYGLVLRLWIEAARGRVCLLFESEAPLDQLREELLESVGDLGVSVFVGKGEAPEVYSCDILLTTMESLHTMFGFNPDAFALLIIDDVQEVNVLKYRHAIDYFRAVRLAFTTSHNSGNDANIRKLFGAPVYSSMKPRTLEEDGVLEDKGEVTHFLEFEQSSLSMTDRLMRAAHRIGMLEGGGVPGSSRVLYERQIGVYLDFAEYLREVATNPELYEADTPTARIILPPRTGKTVLMGQIAMGSGMMTTVVVPRRALVVQTVRELRAQLPNVPIGAYYDSEKSLVWWGINVITYQSLQNLFAEHGCLPPELACSSLVCFDEAHASMTVARQKVIKQGFHILAIRVAFTATPNYSYERRLARYFKRLIHEITITEALELEMVAPMRLWVAEVDRNASTVRVIGEEGYDEDELGKIMSDVPFLEAALQCRYSDENRKKSALLCCVTRQQAGDLAHYFKLRRPPGTPEPAVVIGETRGRDTILRSFDDGVVDTIINVGVLIEGWNAPRCKLLIDLAPVRSWVRATQKFFRPLTKWGTEEAMVCVIIPKGLREPPILPLDLFDWNMPTYEQGELIGSQKQRKSDEARPKPTKNREFGNVESVTVQRRIVFEGYYGRPTLDPKNTEQLRTLLLSSPHITEDKIPFYQEFRWVIFRHELFVGTGATLLRYCGIMAEKISYVVFMARFFPEGAFQVYKNHNYGDVTGVTDWGWCAEDLEHLTTEMYRDKTQLSAGVEIGWDALGGRLEGLKQDPESIMVQCTFPQVVSDLLGSVFSVLSVKQSKILMLRYGLGGEEPLSLEEVGRIFNLTRERIRQMEAGALRRLRRSVHWYQLQELYELISSVR
ncbi:MAG: DEAD/DEAH box helicase family protein [Patescibacteria group bacterium]